MKPIYKSIVIAAGMIGAALGSQYAGLSESASQAIFFSLLALGVATMPRSKPCKIGG